MSEVIFQAGTGWWAAGTDETVGMCVVRQGRAQQVVQSCRCSTAAATYTACPQTSSTNLLTRAPSPIASPQSQGQSRRKDQTMPWWLQQQSIQLHLFSVSRHTDRAHHTHFYFTNFSVPTCVLSQTMHVPDDCTQQCLAADGNGSRTLHLEFYSMPCQLQH